MVHAWSWHDRPSPPRRASFSRGEVNSPCEGWEVRPSFSRSWRYMVGPAISARVPHPMPHSGGQPVMAVPQSERGPGRPTCEVDSLLILAHGLKRFDPKQKRGTRVKIRSIPIDPRVDPAALLLLPQQRRPSFSLTTTTLCRPSQGAAVRLAGGPRRGRQGAARAGPSCSGRARRSKIF